MIFALRGNTLLCKSSGLKISVIFCHWVSGQFVLNSCCNFVYSGKKHWVLVHYSHWSLFTTANAGSCFNFDLRITQDLWQFRQEILCTAQLTSNTITNSDEDIGNRIITTHYFKVVIEGSNFIDLCHRQIHFFCQSN